MITIGDFTIEQWSNGSFWVRRISTGEGMEVKHNVLFHWIDNYWTEHF